MRMHAEEQDLAAEEIMFAFLATRAAHKDPKNCRKRLLGPMRKRVRDISGTDAVAVMTAAPGLIGQVIARGGASESLAKFCRRCGRCELARAEP